MTAPTDDRHFDENAYDRPNDDWVCGWSGEGRPCPIGPSGTGRCQAEQICIPYLKQGRWHCNRPSAWGGKCREGPLPDGACSHPFPTCHPAPNVMARRRALTFAVTATTIGVLLIALGGGGAEQFVSPGEVTAAHGNIGDNCATCHTAADGSVGDWVSLAGRGGDALGDSRRCIDCHVMGAHPLAPHSIEPGELEAIHQRIVSAIDADQTQVVDLIAEIVPDVPLSAEGELACAVCHREHHGRDFDLTYLSDQACQNCHAGRFDSFSHGHPEFGDYPHERRSRIHFDHGTHYGRHFGLYERLMRKGVAPEACSTCHVPDDAGATMLVRGFEASCASCHATQIEDHGLPGVEFIRLAAVDRQALGERDIGEWPAVGQGDGPPPFLELLLSADPDYRAARETLGNVPLSDLDGVDEEQLAAAATIVWSTKRLIHELVEHRDVALETRITNALPESVDAIRLAALTGRPAHGDPFFDAFTAAQRAWLPNLAVELAARDGAEAASEGVGSTDGGMPADVGPQQIETDLLFGNWRLSAKDQSLQFRPAGHADPLLTNWIEVSADVAGRGYPASADPDTAMGPAEAALVEMLEQMSNSETAGRCMKCHTLDRLADGGLAVNWRGARPRESLREFTHFSHAPHLTLLGGGESCGECHAVESHFDLLDRDFVNPDWSPSTDSSMSLTSGLRSLSRERCVECHTASRAGEGCLTCHNYHIGQFLPAPRTSR